MFLQESVTDTRTLANFNIDKINYFLIINNLTELPLIVLSDPQCKFKLFIYSLLESLKEHKQLLSKFSEHFQYFHNRRQLEEFFSKFQDKEACLNKILNPPAIRNISQTGRGPGRTNAFRNRSNN